MGRKPWIVEPLNQSSSELPENMEAWNGLGVPTVLLQALADLKFTTPTNIQALTLPAAIFGQRDILGAAETGSGKTLAFGIPIITGILNELSGSTLRFNSNKSIENNHVESDIDTDKEGTQNNAHNDAGGSGDSEDSEDVSDGFAEDLSEDLSDEDIGSGAKCVRVIDNANFNFPIMENPESKGSYANKPLYALVLTPTRELAVQVMEHLRSVAKYTSITVAVVVGGMSSQKQNRILNRAPEIVVATPGRLWDLITEGHPHLANVENIRFLAIDETDRMLERGHFEELQNLLERVNASDVQKHNRQNFVFSATLALTHDIPHYVKNKRNRKSKVSKITPGQKLASIIETVGLTNPKVVDITETSGVAHALTEAHIVCSLTEKDYYLYYFLLRYPGRTLVFCNSISCVQRLAQLFSMLKCSISPLHAHMHQHQRLKNLERFRDNSQSVLLATDVAARGLDIPKVQHVIHYQVPCTAETYVHRSGRTARAEEEGLTVIFVEPAEVQKFSRLFHTLGRDPCIPVFPVENMYMQAVKERVNIARQLELYELQERRTKSKQQWINRVAKEMDIVLSDEEISDDELQTSLSTASSVKRNVAEARKQLRFLLDKPLFPKGFSLKFPSLTIIQNVPHPRSMQVKENPTQNAIQTLKQDVEKKQAEKRTHNTERSRRHKKRRKKASL